MLKRKLKLANVIFIFSLYEYRNAVAPGFRKIDSEMVFFDIYHGADKKLLY